MTEPGAIEVHFLRHGDAGDPAADGASDDRRPLSGLGERQAERLGRFLASVGFRPDAIIASPKVRAIRTAEIVGRSIGVDVGTDERLGRSLDLVAVEAILFDAGEPVRPVLVGHDPDVTELVSALVGGDVPIRKGALARVDAVRPLRPGSGVLRWLVPPDLLEHRGR